MHITAVCAGLAVSLGYQTLYTLPRWQRLVGAHLEANRTTGAQALGLLLAFGAFYNFHNIAQVRRRHWPRWSGSDTVTGADLSRSLTVILWACCPRIATCAVEFGACSTRLDANLLVSDPRARSVLPHRSSAVAGLAVMDVVSFHSQPIEKRFHYWACR